MRSWCLATLVLTACASPGEGGEAAGEDGKEDRGGSAVAAAFVEVDPTHTSATFRKYIGKALAELEADAGESEIARLTLASIKAGRVKIDELVDLTCWDFDRARRDVTGVELESTDWKRLRSPGSAVAAAITDELDGYMWQDRIYVSRGQTARKLAATLVHEVNHVINRSEVGYYDDLPTSAFLHEVRAFYAESLFDPAVWEGVDLVDFVITTYELDRAWIPEEILADPITPRLMPDAAAWRERKVEDDPVDVDSACPGRR